MQELIKQLPTIVVAIIGMFGTYFAGAHSLDETLAEQASVNREIDIKMIDTALAILAGEKGESQKEQPIEARRFALRVLRQYSALEEPRNGELPIDWEAWATNERRLKLNKDVLFSNEAKSKENSIPKFKLEWDDAENHKKHLCKQLKVDSPEYIAHGCTRFFGTK